MEDQNTELARTEANTGRAVALRSAPLDQIKRQAKDVQGLLENLMEEGEHYGKIFPGQKKPTLLQPGAEKLCSAFGMTPRYDVETIPVEGEGIPWGHREVRVTASLYTRGDQTFLGQGVGVCTTLEPKYRYREASETTEVEVPGEFWESGDSQAERDFDTLRDALDATGKDYPSSASLGTEKVEGVWYITYKAGRAENPDPAAEWNTVTKMAKKRALVDAVKTATAASDIFTQDVEDMEPEQFGGNGGGHGQRSQQNQQQGRQQQRRGQSGGSGGGSKYPQALANVRRRLQEVSEDPNGDIVKAVQAALDYVEPWPPQEWKRAAAIIRKHVPEDAEIKIPDTAPSADAS